MHTPDRRDFLRASLTAAASCAACAGLAVGRRAAGAVAAATPVNPDAKPPATQPAAPPKPFSTTLHKAMIVAKVDDATLRPLKDAGFEGVEARGAVPEDQAAEGRELAERMGMRVHSV